MVKIKTLAMQLCSAAMWCHCKTCILLCPTLMGFCQDKKKIREKLGQTTPTHPPIQVFTFLETFGNMKTTQKNTKKTQNPPPKKKIRVEA